MTHLATKTRKRETTKRTIWFSCFPVFVFFVFSWLPLLGVWAQAPRDADWPVNGGIDNIRYSPLTQITRDNVSTLRVAWTYDSHDAFKASEMQSNPVVVDGVLYATTPTLKVVAVDAATGREVWKSKAGLIRLTTTLASLATTDHIRVNCLAPGWIATDGPRQYWESLTPAERLERGVPSRLLTTDQIADAVVRLATDTSLAGRGLVWWSEDTPRLIRWGDRGYAEYDDCPIPFEWR